MAGIAVPRPQLTQPQGRLLVARPWANNLRGAFLLRDRTVFDPISGLMLSGTGAQGVHPFGTAYDISATSHYIDTGVADLSGVTLHAEDGVPFSVTIKFRTTTTGTVIARAGATLSARTFQLFSNGTSQSPVVVVRGTQTAYNWGYQDGEWHTVTVAWDGGTVWVYGDTNREASFSRGDAVEETTQRILIGARSNGANFALSGSSVEFAYVFDRALTRDEHLALVDNPYQVFRTERRIYAVEATGGGSIDIAGGSTGTGAASASLTTAITVTGAASVSAAASMALSSNAAAIAGASGASASAALGLTTSIAVTGAASASSAAALALSTHVAVSGSAAGASSAALELSGASSAAIAGAASASASSAMALTTNIRVAGGASGSAAASMLLAGSLPIEITGGAVATAQAFAELTTAILIAGATGGNCTAALELYEQEFIENVSGRVMRVEDAGRSFRVPREVEASPVRRERTMRVGRAN